MRPLLFLRLIILTLTVQKGHTTDDLSLGEEGYTVETKTYGQGCNPSKREYCATIRGLTCSQTNICECPEGQVWVSSRRCRLPVGSQCNPGLSTNLEPRCTDGAYCMLLGPPSPRKANKTQKVDEDHPEPLGICKCMIKNCNNGHLQLGPSMFLVTSLLFQSFQNKMYS